jgi:hypothetical protein
MQNEKAAFLQSFKDQNTRIILSPFFFLAVLGSKPRALCTLAKHCTTELYPSPHFVSHCLLYLQCFSHSSSLNIKPSPFFLTVTIATTSIYHICSFLSNLT